MNVMFALQTQKLSLPHPLCCSVKRHICVYGQHMTSLTPGTHCSSWSGSSEKHWSLNLERSASFQPESQTPAVGAVSAINHPVKMEICRMMSSSLMLFDRFSPVLHGDLLSNFRSDQSFVVLLRNHTSVTQRENTWVYYIFVSTRPRWISDITNNMLCSCPGALSCESHCPGSNIHNHHDHTVVLGVPTSSCCYFSYVICFILKSSEALKALFRRCSIVRIVTNNSWFTSPATEVCFALLES